MGDAIPQPVARCSDVALHSVIVAHGERKKCRNLDNVGLDAFFFNFLFLASSHILIAIQGVLFYLLDSWQTNDSCP